MSSQFLTVWLPLLVGAIIWYGYNAGGFMGEWIQGLVDPILKFGGSILNFIFGI